MIKRVFNSTLFRSATVYASGNLVNGAIPFLLLPVLTRYLTPKDYGIVAMFWVVMPIATALMGLSVDTAIGRKYFEKSIDLPKYIANCMYILVAGTIVVSLVFFFLSGVISTYSEIPAGWLWAVLVISFCQYIYQIPLILWRAQGKPLPFSLLQIGQTSLNLGLSIGLIVLAGMNWQGRVEAQLVTFVVFGAVAFIILWRGKWLKWDFDKRYIQDALKFGAPLIPHIVGWLVVSMTDRVLITNLVGLADTGIYTVGFQFGLVITLLHTSFNQALVPWFYEEMGKDDYSAKRKIVQVTYLYMALLLVSAVALAFIAPWFLRHFVGKEFVGAYRYVFWIALGMAFNGMYVTVANYILYVQKTYLLTIITSLLAVLNAFICYFLIMRNGTIGAAQAMAISYFLFFIITWFVSARICKMPWIPRLSKTH